MVSFHCNGCTDVIKKPKLDQHYSRCNSSVDCIDCSKTFNSPAEWKSHTSCITEAEKYQKSLYKGPKTGESSNGSRGDVGGRGRWRGRGDIPQYRGGRGGGPGNRRLHYAATGSNDTPLGSPAREFGRSPKTSSDEPAESNRPTEAAHSKTPTTGSEEEAKKGKKRKAADDGEPSNKKFKVEDVVEAVPVATDKKTEKVETEKEKEGKKKKKKEKSDKKDEGELEEQVKKSETKKEKTKKRAAEKDEKDEVETKEERKKAKAARKEEKAALKEEKEKVKASEKEEKAKRKAEKKAKRSST